MSWNPLRLLINEFRQDAQTIKKAYLRLQRGEGLIPKQTMKEIKEIKKGELARTVFFAFLALSLAFTFGVMASAGYYEAKANSFIEGEVAAFKARYGDNQSWTTLKIDLPDSFPAQIDSEEDREAEDSEEDDDRDLKPSGS